MIAFSGASRFSNNWARSAHQFIVIMIISQLNHYIITIIMMIMIMMAIASASYTIEPDHP